MANAVHFRAKEGMKYLVGLLKCLLRLREIVKQLYPEVVLLDREKRPCSSDLKIWVMQL